ncbi:hypothetical protein [Candidatus Halobonum tyrrellensis]|uniref:Uncharacterized protein n=1 Tax=Candidatus Halobonum tyrrellensis G22 TaxID=1324957 RepID=V4J1M9_9EURY|nr:hypothetical protein [Candidatus Halobonum tyrrellensis]ESP89312.1 hypothetical protein K933_04821 [Candidatus Halobonum tyrrellensis G22]
MTRGDDDPPGGGAGERVEWDALEADLRAAGYAVDRQGTGDGETVLLVTVPADVRGLAGDPEGPLDRLLALLPGVRVPTDPAVIPDDVRAAAAARDATAEVHSGSPSELHVVVSADGVW